MLEFDNWEPTFLRFVLLSLSLGCVPALNTRIKKNDNQKYGVVKNHRKLDVYNAVANPATSNWMVIYSSEYKQRLDKDIIATKNGADKNLKTGSFIEGPSRGICKHTERHYWGIKTCGE